MKHVFYHGSKRIIERPLAHGSKKDNDYGAAFYLTKDLDAAKCWACRNETAGYVNAYEFDDGGLKVLDLRKGSEYGILNWLAILLHFRTLEDGFTRAFGTRLRYLEDKYYVDVNQYDWVIGYRADDAYFRFPLDFVRGNLTLEQLSKSYALGDSGVQYALISQKAIDRLCFLRAEVCDEEYVGKYFESVSLATKAYDDLSKDEDGTRIFDLLRRGKR